MLIIMALTLEAKGAVVSKSSPAGSRRRLGWAKQARPDPNL